MPWSLEKKGKNESLLSSVKENGWLVATCSTTSTGMCQTVLILMSARLDVWGIRVRECVWKTEREMINKWRVCGQRERERKTEKAQKRERGGRNLPLHPIMHSGAKREEIDGTAEQWDDKIPKSWERQRQRERKNRDPTHMKVMLQARKIIHPDSDSQWQSDRKSFMSNESSWLDAVWEGIDKTNALW